MSLICVNCVSPQPLKRFVREQGKYQTCNCCDDESVAVESKLLFDFILARIDENLATDGDLSIFEEGMLYDCGADDIAVAGIDIVLSEWLQLGDDSYFGELERYVPEMYKRNDRGHERHYYRDDGELERNFYEAQWDLFVESIRHSHRFFNPNAAAFLRSVFGFLESDDGQLKPQVLRTLPRGQALFRARTVAGSSAAREIVKNPASQLGPTPKAKAGSQRMTPSGIPALYCALERQTCLSEIRCITGDHVVSGAMTPTTQLRLLDLTKLAAVEPPSLTLLDRGYLDGRHLKKFIDSLVRRMSKPKGRNDELSYLSTQVVFEYLRLTFGSVVDGLVFPSVQTGEVGANVVLFPEACVISERTYAPPLFPGDISDPTNKPDYFAVGDKIAFVENSLRFHRVTAIETRAIEYTHVGDLFMSDATRKQLGLPIGSPR